MRLFFIVATLLLIASCSSDQKSDIFLSHPSPTPILVFGDSLSAHYHLGESQGWVYLFNKKLHKEGYLRENQLVSNYSVSGEVTSRGLSRLPRAIQETTPALIIIELGANDGLRRQSLFDMKNNLREMIKISKQSGADVILVGVDLPPRFFFVSTRDFRQVYKDLAREMDVLLLENILQGVNSTPANMLSDNLHPNEKGQVIMLSLIHI